MNWKEIIHQTNQPSKQPERYSVEPQRENVLDVLSTVRAHELLQGVQRDVWGVGEVAYVKKWTFPQPGEWGHVLYEGISPGEGYVLEFQYPVLLLKSDFSPRVSSPRSRYSSDGDIFTGGAPINLRAEVGTRSKKLAILIVKTADHASLIVDTQECVAKAHRVVPIAKAEVGSSLRLLPGVNFRESVERFLQSAVVGCYRSNDLPVQLKQKAAAEIEECRRRGGVQQVGGYNGWYKWKG